MEEETGVPGENLSRVTDKLYHIMLHWVHPTWVGFEITTLVVIGADCTGSCKFNYHTIATTTVPIYIQWRRQGSVPRYRLRGTYKSVLKSYHFRSWFLLLPLKAEEQSQIGLKNADSKFQMVDLFTGDDGQKVMTIPHMTLWVKELQTLDNNKQS